MPPKTRITKEMIIEAAMNVIREKGAENLNVREIAKRLDCSTQPVMYHFATMEDLKREVYAHADQYHTGYLLTPKGDRDPLLGIGLNYIRFAVEEAQLFRFLFQSGYAMEKDLPGLIGSEEMRPVLTAMQEGLQMSMEKTKEVFLTIGVFAHGYACLVANLGVKYDEELAASHLEKAFEGAVMIAVKE